MNDLISRQAAIDAAIDAADDWDGGYSLSRADMIERAINNLPSAQPDVSDINVGDINKFIDGLEEIFADIRERNGDDIVCGLCEFDGAYIGESGDWCNECPGFNRDDCFKLSDRIREKWIAEIINTRTISGGRAE